jgi:hypothetical protein
MTYSTRTIPLHQATGRSELGNRRSWDELHVEICDSFGKKIGEYLRTYHTMYRTFCPFQQGEKEYALYAPTAYVTRVMSLPDCTDIGGEVYKPAAFCPTDYYVPDAFDGKFGFIAGCHWGDDSSWKIRLIDLRDPANPLFRERFGYVAMPNTDVKLSDIIQIERCDEGVEIKIQCEMNVFIEDQEFATGFRNDNEFYGLAADDDTYIEHLRIENARLKERLRAAVGPEL